MILESFLSRMTHTSSIEKRMNIDKEFEKKVNIKTNEKQEEECAKDQVGKSILNLEKLTVIVDEFQEFLDIVEDLLTRQISSRSTDFFLATANFNYLETHIKS